MRIGATTAAWVVELPDTLRIFPHCAHQNRSEKYARNLYVFLRENAAVFQVSLIFDKEIRMKKNPPCLRRVFCFSTRIVYLEILSKTFCFPSISSIGIRSGPPAIPETLKRKIGKYSVVFTPFCSANPAIAA